MEKYISNCERIRAAEPESPEADVADSRRLLKTAGDALPLVSMHRVNVLVSGTDEAVSPVIQALLGSVQPPISSWRPGDPLTLPQPGRHGTLLLYEVGSLLLQEQIRLLEWSAHAAGRIQIISTTSVPLLQRVHAGAFIDTLYYRLNTVYMDGSESSNAS